MGIYCYEIKILNEKNIQVYKKGYAASAFMEKVYADI